MSKEPIVAYKVIKVGWRYYVAPYTLTKEFIWWLVSENKLELPRFILKGSADKVCKMLNKAYNNGYNQRIIQEYIEKQEGNWNKGMKLN